MTETTKKIGRKPLDPSGEIRKVKLGTYITLTLYEDIQDLARLNRKTTGDFINDLLRREVEKNSDKLKKLKELALEAQTDEFIDGE